MEDHAKAVADRWAVKRQQAIDEGIPAELFDAEMLDFMIWAGWDEKTAKAIVRRAQRKCGRGVDECE